MTTIATICARGGSKGVPGKNSRVIAGKPLIAHTIEFALSNNRVDVVVFSSDDVGLLRIASSYEQVKLVTRPPELATDSASKIPVIRHAIEVMYTAGVSAETILDFDPTSPLRIHSDVTGVLSLLEAPGCTNVVTGCKSRRNPYFNMLEIDQVGVPRLCKSSGLSITSRQQAPQVYDMNASIYGWKRDALFASQNLLNSGTRLFEMPAERSLDIDSEFDLYLVEKILTDMHKLSG